MFSSSTSGSFFVGNRQANLSTDYIIRLCINDSAALALHVRWWNMVVYHLMTGSHFGWTSMRQGKFQLWDWTLQSFGIVSVCFFLSIWLLKVTEICLSVLCHGFGTEYNRNRGLPGVSEAWPGMRCVLPCVFVQIFVAERWCLLQTAWDCGCDYGGQITTSKQKKQDFSIACLHEIEELSAPLSDDSRWVDVLSVVSCQLVLISCQMGQFFLICACVFWHIL